MTAASVSPLNWAFSELPQALRSSIEVMLAPVQLRDLAAAGGAESGSGSGDGHDHSLNRLVGQISLERQFMRVACKYASNMSNVRIRNVPDDLHRRLKARAALEGTTVSDLLLHEIERLVDRPSKAEVIARITGRDPVALPENAADAIRAERDAR